ncbi:MAG: short-chain fatty acyl-CoA regulator family protein, partial [Marinomonas sp.]
AQTVAGTGGVGEASFAIVLGVESGLALDTAAARGLDLTVENAQPIGLGCARCHRAGCRQRSLPPRGAPLHIDRIIRGVTPFDFRTSEERER